MELQDDHIDDPFDKQIAKQVGINEVQRWLTRGLIKRSHKDTHSDSDIEFLH